MTKIHLMTPHNKCKHLMECFTKSKISILCTRRAPRQNASKTKNPNILFYSMLGFKNVGGGGGNRIGRQFIELPSL